MIVYHGSNSNFKKLRISKDLVQRRSTAENEGYGIYFALDKDIAKSYGKYLYTLEINDQYILDFRKKEVCRAYIDKLRHDIRKTIEVDINNYINIETVINYAHIGGIGIVGIPREIYLLLDSCEEWYKNVCKTKRDRVIRLLNSYSKRNLKAYMFNYNIKNIGVIKDTSDDVVRIVSKTSSY